MSRRDAPPENERRSDLFRARTLYQWDSSLGMPLLRPLNRTGPEVVVALVRDVLRAFAEGTLADLRQLLLHRSALAGKHGKAARVGASLLHARSSEPSHVQAIHEGPLARLAPMLVPSEPDSPGFVRQLLRLAVDSVRNLFVAVKQLLVESLGRPGSAPWSPITYYLPMFRALQLVPTEESQALFAQVRGSDVVRVSELRRGLDLTWRAEGCPPARGYEDYARWARAVVDATHDAPRTASREPDGSWRFLDDRELGWQRLAGPNPMMLKRVPATVGGAIPELPGLTEALYQRGVAVNDPGFAGTLAADLEAGRLFLVDQVLAHNLPAGSWASQRRLPPVACVALFRVRADGLLLPVVIQLGQAVDQPRLVLPDEGDTWICAKQDLQSTDLQIHEMSTHLCRTHFVLETLAVALRRNIPTDHPVWCLVGRHLDGVVFNNYVGRLLLMQPGGMVDQLLGSDLAGAYEMVGRAWRELTLADLNPTRELASRGLTDDLALAALPVFPYRDDALRLWAPIRRYVAHFLAVFDVDLADDPWVADLRDDLIATLGPHRVRLDTQDDLVDLLASLIFTSGPQHAAVNFGQWDHFLFVPNAPAGLYPSEDPRPEARLPDPPTTFRAIETMALLAGRRFTHLADVPLVPDAASVRDTFRRDLREIEHTINHENVARARLWAAYPYLLPSRIPRSANV